MEHPFRKSSHIVSSLELISKSEQFFFCLAALLLRTPLYKHPASLKRKSALIRVVMYVLRHLVIHPQNTVVTYTSHVSDMGLGELSQSRTSDTRAHSSRSENTAAGESGKRSKTSDQPPAKRKSKLLNAKERKSMLKFGFRLA